MLTGIDNIVIVFTVIAVLWIGYYFSKSITDMESYYLANRSLPWSLVVGTLVASWYGGVGVVGTIGYASVFGMGHGSSGRSARTRSAFLSLCGSGRASTCVPT